MRRGQWSFVLLSVVLVPGMMLSPNSAAASTITIFENAQLTTGSLAGTNFDLSFSYDSTSLLGSGQEFISMTAFDFNLLGTPYTLADKTQGGQAIFQDGALQNINITFLTIPPRTAPVFSISFQGNPGMIGYINLNGEFGAGTFAPPTVPEPSSLLCLFLGLALFVKRVRRPSVLHFALAAGGGDIVAAIPANKN